MARSYRRDARGRFAGGGYSGQTGGRGARLKGGGAKRAGGGNTQKAAKRATPSGAIRAADVRQARISNAISKNIERRNAAGLNPPTAARENQGARVARASRAIAARTGQVQKLGFESADFARRSQRTASIRNPEVKQKAQSLYGKILNLDSSPKQLRSMFKKASKPKAGGRSAAQRRSEREHKAMLAAANRLFR